MALVAATDDALRSAISAGSVTLAYYSPRGQEAVAAGFAAALEPDDYLVTTYRGLHDQIAKGVPLRPLLAEMLGRAEGTGKGKGGPMHVVVARRRAHAHHGRGRLGAAHRGGPGLGGGARRARAASPWRRSATAPPTSAPSTKPPTWPRCGAPGGLPVPEQRVRRAHRLRRPPARRARGGSGRRLRHARRDRRRQRSRGGVRGGVDGRGAGPGPGRARPWSKR